MYYYYVPFAYENGFSQCQVVRNSPITHQKEIEEIRNQISETYSNNNSAVSILNYILLREQDEVIVNNKENKRKYYYFVSYLYNNGIAFGNTEFISNKPISTINQVKLLAERIEEEHFKSKYSVFITNFILLRTE